MNPLLTANWRKATGVRKARSDAVDAEALALWLLAGNPAARRRSKPETDDMRSLARSRNSLSHIVGDSKRRAHAIVDVVFPEFHGFFADDFGKAGSAVPGKWGSAANVASARVDPVEKAIRGASGGRFGRADAERLKALARSSVGQHSAPLVLRLRQLLAQIEFTRGQMAELDAELARMVGGSPITTIPGIGAVCAAGILGEIGDVSRFESASRLVAFAGCDPSAFESGGYEGPKAHLSKRGSPYLRWHLWLAADRARMFDPVLRDYYIKKRSEGKCHKVAVSAVVRELCAIVFAVLRDGKPYVCPVA
ncbi:transposase, IS116/IS110/IS902 family [Olsenella profusa F0195]|uniref:Transposase, IS116/IS110/IS902 family n=1 Tax=Olsenella profusa F0195 TaxID=1125712 RepID=U2V3K0_9ACTN|nr:transposase, IS116/IS110/IS902 family [Olsenella profusa F0195]